MANDREMIIPIKAKDETKAGRDRAERGFKNLARTAGSALAIIGGAAVLKKSIDLWAAQEQAVLQVERRIKSTGGAAGVTSKQLQDMASALQKVTIFGDETILQMQSLLLTFTGVKGQTFDRATKSILDMAAALAASNGGTPDLRGAATMVGKALNDPVLGLTAMSRAGIQFSDVQKETIKNLVETNKQAEAQAVILRELERQFGGAAQAQGLSGAMAQAHNAFGDLLEDFANAVTGTTDLETGIRNLTAAMQDSDTVSTIEAIGTALGFVANQSVSALTGFKNLAGGIALVAEGKMSLLDFVTASKEDMATAIAEFDAELAAEIKNKMPNGETEKALDEFSISARRLLLKSGARQLDLGGVGGIVGSAAPETPAPPRPVQGLGGAGGAVQAGGQDVQGPSEAVIDDLGVFSSLVGSVDALQQTLMTQEEAIQASYQRRLELIQQAKDQGVQVGGLEARAFADKERRMTAMHKQQSAARLRQTMTHLSITQNLFNNVFGAISAGLDENNRSDFEKNKRLQKAQAVMNTAAGATKAFSQYGWPWGAVAAAAVIAAGVVQIQKINSQRYGGGDSSAAPAPAATPIDTTSPAVQAALTPEPVTQPVGGPTYNIQVYGNVVDHDQFARELIAPLERARLDGVQEAA